MCRQASIAASGAAVPTAQHSTAAMVRSVFCQACTAQKKPPGLICTGRKAVPRQILQLPAQIWLRAAEAQAQQRFRWLPFKRKRVRLALLLWNNVGEWPAELGPVRQSLVTIRRGHVGPS